MRCKVCGKKLVETKSEPYEDEGKWYIDTHWTCPDYRGSDDMTAWVFKYSDHDDVIQWAQVKK